MDILKENELLEINGGASLSGTLVNAFTTAGKFIYNLGHALGSSLRRIAGGGYCSV